MIKKITGFFSDLTVSKKLFIGFGLVLILTMAVALTGFFSINTILSRQALMTTISQVNVSFNHALQSEKEFALTGGDDAKAATENEISKAISLLGDAALLTDRPEFQKQFRLMASQSEDYLSYFEEMITARRDADIAREAMETTANGALSTFKNLETGFFSRTREILSSGRLSSEDPLSLAETSAELSGNIADLRQNEFAYITTQDPEALKRWQATFNETREITTDLAGWQEGKEKKALDKAITSLTGYQQAFKRYQQTQAISEAAEARMAQGAEAVFTNAEEASRKQQSIMDSVSRNSYVTLSVISGSAIALGLLSAFFIARLILVPLRSTVLMAQRIAAGDLTETVEVTRKDELGQLSLAMQDMTQRLRELIGKISESITQVALEAEQLSQVTEDTSNGVQRQKAETDQTATAVEEMAASVVAVAESAGQASTAAAGADLKTQEGDHTVRKVVIQINQLKDVIEQSAGSVNKLNTESQEIGKILDVIKAVAEQTNLLALNAAIEAARAGEQGRGFAVVADEVRALASRTQNSTTEIESLIGSLQSVSSKAAKEMESSLKLTGDTVSLAGEASTLLGEIAQAVSTIDQMNKQIAAAATEQSSVASEISGSVTRLRDIGEDSASATQHTASSSAELAKLGNELQKIVGQFKT